MASAARPRKGDYLFAMAERADEPVLEILRRFWPPERQILLLTAALAPPKAAAEAWRKWNCLCTLEEATSPEVRLLACVAQRMPELDPMSPLMPRLTGARRYIFTRTQLTLAAARPLLTALCEADLRLMLLKGGARIAENPWLSAERTLRDVDILVHPDDLDAALAIVDRLDWRPRLPNPWTGNDDALGERLPATHAIGLRSPDPKASGVVDLHQFSLNMCRNVGDDVALWARTRKSTLMGMPFFVPSTTDSVLITLAHSLLFSKGEKTADWALDIEHAIHSKDIDWKLFLAEAHARRIEAFLAAPLMLAAERLGMDVPAAVIAELTLDVDETFLNEFAFLATSTFNTVRSDVLLDHEPPDHGRLGG